MGRKRPQTPIFVQDIVVKSRSFPLFPPSFQHSTSVLHMPRGKKAHTPPFHNSSTAPSPKQRPQKSAWRLSEGEFSTPSPAPTTVTTTSTIRHRAKSPASSSKRCGLFGEKELSNLPAADCGPKAAKDPAEKSEKLTRLRVCGFASRPGETAGAARTEAPFPRPRGTRSGPSLLRSGSGASRRALPADAAWPIPSRPRAQKPFWMIHKNWKSSGGGWKKRPAKMEIGPGLSANFQPGSRHRKHPPELPAEREKGPSAVCINIQNIVNTGAGRRRLSGGSPCEKRNKLSIKRR